MPQSARPVQTAPQCKRQAATAHRRYERETLVLGIETSCDETAAAVVARGADGARPHPRPTSCARSGSSIARFGGVVPEIAARAHVECLDEIIAEAMREAGVGFEDLDARGGHGRARPDRRPAGRA